MIPSSPAAATLPPRSRRWRSVGRPASPAAPPLPACPASCSKGAGREGRAAAVWVSRPRAAEWLPVCASQLTRCAAEAATGACTCPTNQVSPRPGIPPPPPPPPTHTHTIAHTHSQAPLPPHSNSPAARDPQTPPAPAPRAPSAPPPGAAAAPPTPPPAAHSPCAPPRSPPAWSRRRRRRQTCGTEASNRWEGAGWAGGWRVAGVAAWAAAWMWGGSSEMRRRGTSHSILTNCTRLSPAASAPPTPHPQGRDSPPLPPQPHLPGWKSAAGAEAAGAPPPAAPEPQLNSSSTKMSSPLPAAGRFSASALRFSPRAPPARPPRRVPPPSSASDGRPGWSGEAASWQPCSAALRWMRRACGAAAGVAGGVGLGPGEDTAAGGMHATSSSRAGLSPSKGNLGARSLPPTYPPPPTHTHTHTLHTHTMRCWNSASLARRRSTGAARRLMPCW